MAESLYPIRFLGRPTNTVGGLIFYHAFFFFFFFFLFFSPLNLRALETERNQNRPRAWK